MPIIREPARDLPVTGSYDLVVVGGGVAGVAAALAGARAGASVALIEKEYGLGGLATLGNIIVYEPLCDGHGRQIVGGLGEELLKRSVRDLGRDCRRLGLERAPACWTGSGSDEERSQKRYVARYNPAAFQLELEALITEAGIDLWYDTRLCQVIRAGDRITHLVIENKDGRGALACGVVVDASGDADVCHLAGETTVSLDTNVLAGWHYCLRDDELSLRALSKRFPDDGGTEGTEGPLFSGVRARDVTRQVVGSRAWIREQFATLRAKHPGVDIQPVALASFPNFRMTRRLETSCTLRGSDENRWFDDCIGMTGHWRRRGPVYALPWRSIRADRVRNLMAVGRCMASSDQAWDCTRVIPPAIVTGEAAGVAAALAMQGLEGDLHRLDIGVLQDRLRSQGAIIDRSLIPGEVARVAGG